MRALVRPKVSLPTLIDVRNRYPADKSVDEGGAPEGLWNKPDVRGAVYAIGGRVCAYCQREASDARGDIEHFRPKSLYRWLMYEFTNYLLGCRVCNSSRKSNTFPMAPRAKPIAFRPSFLQDRDLLLKTLAQERRLLVDPTADPVDGWAIVDFENPLCPVEPSDEAKKDRRARDRVATTIEFFGLNTIPELVRDRFDAINSALTALESWRGGEAKRREDLLRMSNRYEPHGWAVRQVLGRLAPDLALSAAAEDFERFIKKTLEDLRVIGLILQGQIPAKDRTMVDARKQEASWTVAVLWRDPSVVSSDQVRQWITEAGMLAQLQPFYDQLA